MGHQILIMTALVSALHLISIECLGDGFSGRFKKNYEEARLNKDELNLNDPIDTRGTPDHNRGESSQTPAMNVEEARLNNVERNFIDLIDKSGTSTQVEGPDHNRGESSQIPAMTHEEQVDEAKFKAFKKNLAAIDKGKGSRYSKE